MPSREDGSTSLLQAPPSQGKGPTAALPAFDIAIASKPASVSVARRVADAWIRCHCQMSADSVDDVLVVLCTNAVQHGRRESIDVRGWMPAPDRLRLEVHDKSPSPVPCPQHVGPEGESGRGLLLVDILIAGLGGDWGFSDDGTSA
ncbi:ATP-binding protein [Streptomyces sp. NPDC005279]|uniref:ATP-binding protein n=1 Tax=Streptomyces sp. NPDC005279 TaxID=3364712 RepID=UPI00368284E8